MILYRILHVIFPAFFRLLGAKDYGAENLPLEGGVIVVVRGEGEVVDEQDERERIAVELVQ